MKTATVRELRNRYRSVLSWVEAGEEVTISRRGKVIARLVPESDAPKKVDWSQSPAMTQDRTGWKKLTARQAKALLDDSRGNY